MAYSLDLRIRIVKAVEAGHNHHEVAEQYAVGVATVRRYVRRAKKGELAAESPPGRAANIAAEAYPYLAKQVRKHSDATLEQHCEIWFETPKVEVSTTAMCRTLQRAGLTRKKRR
jgi:transposase